jgi:putative transposase
MCQFKNVFFTDDAGNGGCDLPWPEMPRPPRSFEPGGLYHLFSRGSNRHEIAIDDGDRIDLLLCAERAFRRHRVECFGYVVMPNHYHFVVFTPDGDISAAMKELNGRFSLRFNRRHGRDAHTFKNRFGAVRLERESHLLWASAYVAANPVRAGLCPRPENWAWSSYRATVGLERPLTLLNVQRLFSYLGDTSERAQPLCRFLVDSCAGIHSSHPTLRGDATPVSDTGFSS